MRGVGTCTRCRGGSLEGPGGDERAAPNLFHGMSAGRAASNQLHGAFRGAGRPSRMSRDYIGISRVRTGGRAEDHPLGSSKLQVRSCAPPGAFGGTSYLEKSLAACAGARSDPAVQRRIKPHRWHGCPALPPAGRGGSGLDGKPVCEESLHSDVASRRASKSFRLSKG